jgi:hypothetical protein
MRQMVRFGYYSVYVEFSGLRFCMDEARPHDKSPQIDLTLIA